MTQDHTRVEEPPERDPAWALYHCANIKALSERDLRWKLIEFLRKAGFKVFGNGDMHKFSGAGGVTATAIIGASCADVHTWPEHGTALIRCFYCQDHAQYGAGHAEQSNDAKAQLFRDLWLDFLKPRVAYDVPERSIPTVLPVIVPSTWSCIHGVASNVRRLVRPRRLRAMT